MIKRVRGVLDQKETHYVLIDVGGIGLKVFVSSRTRMQLPQEGEIVTLFTHLHLPEGSMDLYGFSTERELTFFEQLISISGVGPKSALSVLDVAELNELLSAIQEGRPDLLSQASGVGRKTAERIIIELRNKVEATASGETLKRMESDADLVEMLVGLGYRKEEARQALQEVTKGTVEERLKTALKKLTHKK